MELATQQSSTAPGYQVSEKSFVETWIFLIRKYEDVRANYRPA
jgi:hypothetical protein